MIRTKVTASTRVAHVVGPGKIKIINGHPAFEALECPPIRLEIEVLRTVLCYGDVTLSDAAMAVFLDHGVSVACLTPGGNRCRGRLVSERDGTALLRIAQHRLMNDPCSRLAVARDIVRRKVTSQIETFRCFQRRGRLGLLPPSMLQQLQDALSRSQAATTLDVLRGFEGAATAAWFNILSNLFVPPWRFAKRTRRPPLDPVNSLLSLGYMLLTQRAVARCEAEGLEVALGSLHEFRPGRPSLACDLIEALRAPVVDRWVVSICDKHKLAPHEFQTEFDGAVHLTQRAFPIALLHWEDKWRQWQVESLLDHQIETQIACVRAYGKGHAAFDVIEGTACADL